MEPGLNAFESGRAPLPETAPPWRRFVLVFHKNVFNGSSLAQQKKPKRISDLQSFLLGFAAVWENCLRRRKLVFL